MAVKVKYQIVMFVALVFFISSCVEFEEVSPIPEIEFKSVEFFEGYDTSLSTPMAKLVMSFSFIDGDADLGVYKEVHADESLPDSVRYGLFVDFYEKVDGQYFERLLIQEVREPDTSYIDTVEFNQLIPFDEKLERVGQNKTVKGIIRWELPISNNVPYDTMMLEFYIRDRALNKSNVERTNDFTIDYSSNSGGN